MLNALHAMVGNLGFSDIPLRQFPSCLNDLSQASGRAAVLGREGLDGKVSPRGHDEEPTSVVGETKMVGR